MSQMKQKITNLHWQNIADDMHDKGFALVPQFLSTQQCDELINLYEQPDTFRKTIVMERYRFGLGEYKYFQYPLPELIQNIRENIYPHLAPIANLWMKVLNIPNCFPDNWLK